jgi:hypothetical protein
MTVEEFAEVFDLPDSGSAELLRRQTHIQIDGIRQNTFRRLITMYNLMKAEYEERGPVYNDWLNQKDEKIDTTFSNFVHGLTVDDYQTIAELGDEYFKIQSDWLEVSDRTAEDYLKTLRAFVKF